MARMLYQRDSALFMLNAVRRHQRLCRKNPGGESFIQAIVPAFSALEDRCKLLEEASHRREDAYDDILLADLDLDNTIRNVFDACKTFDRTHSEGSLVNLVFSNGTFSEIVRLPYQDEPNVADTLAVKIEKLGNTHELYPMADAIRKATANVRKAIEVHKEAIRNEKSAEAEVEIAKAGLIRAYEVNYLEARKKSGSAKADRLFPALSSRVKEEDTGESPAETNNK